MKRRAGKILGLAIGQKSVLIAEVSSKGDSAAATQLAEFSYPEGLSLEKSAELGKALGNYLKARKIGTREAVIGLPAKRLVTRKKEVPPAQPAIAAGMLRIQAEGEFSSEPEGLVMDYAGKTSTTEARSVLLIAASRESITQCEEMAKAAGLKLRGVTATATALARATADLPGGGNGVVVSLGSGSGELIVQHGDSLSQLRHLNIPEGSTDPIGGISAEIRRTVAAIGRNGTPMSLSIWGDKREAGGGSGLEEKLNMPVTLPELRSLVTTESASSGLYAPAVAVALAGLDTEGLPVDFLDSRLAPPPVQTNKQRIMWGSIIGGIIVLLVVAALVDLHLLKTELAKQNDHFASIEKDYTAAQLELDHFNTVHNWSTHKARVTACLRDLTKLFPDEGTVWATTITLHPDLSGELSGKATSEREALSLRDKMEAAGKLFAGTKRYEWHGSTGKNGQQGDGSFVINFTYHGTE